MNAEVVVAEDVWGQPFDELARNRLVMRTTTPDIDDLARARALVVRNKTIVSRDLLTAAPNLQVVARAGVGLDNIDVPAADDLGVVVVAPLGVNAVSVAEHCLGLALATARRIAELDAGTKAGRWDRKAGRELAGGVWGLLSAGATARATGRLARALGMSVVAYDPYISPQHPELAEIGITLAPLDEVVAAADTLSIHLPATAETDRLVGERLLAMAKPNLILVNVGRGEVVDEEALAKALTAGQIAGAALDVRREEPPALGKLEVLPNVVLTPHIAGLTTQSQARIAEILCTDIATVLDGGAARYAATHAASPTR